MGTMVRYHGGKVRSAENIISLFPDHDGYIEAFGGGAAVLLAKPRARREVYNDFDGDMATFFRVLQNTAGELAEAIAKPPFSLAEHKQPYECADTDLDRARQLLIRSHLGRGVSICRKTGFRAAGLWESTLPVHGWQKLSEVVQATAERMRGVVIEQRSAIDVMLANDGPLTLHYVDPPYFPETRCKGRDYQFKLTWDEHIRLVQVLRDLEGDVVLSGYESRLYDEVLSDWQRIEFWTRADGAAARTEVLWINFEPSPQLPLFHRIVDR